MKKILVTDSLFIHDKHVKKLSEHGYEVERLDKPEATEAELIEAVKGKSGYILGGIEKVTEAIIDAADELKVISFTGADPYGFIPGHKKATEKGIVITNSPGANAHSVAEYTVSVTLAMVRNLFELTRTGSKTFETTQSLSDLTIGLIGMGRIGGQVAHMLTGLGVKEILYSSPSEKSGVPATKVSQTELLKRSDVVSMHAPSTAGLGYIGVEELASMKDHSLIVDCGFIGGIDLDALYEELSKGRLKAFLDYPADERFNNLPFGTFMHSNAHTAYNTHETSLKASDMAVESILSVLETGKDQYQVN